MSIEFQNKITFSDRVELIAERTREEVFREIMQYGDTSSLSSEQWIALLLEEIGEVAKEANDFSNKKGIRDSSEWNDHKRRLIGELKQVAALAIHWSAHLGIEIES